MINCNLKCVKCIYIYKEKKLPEGKNTDILLCSRYSEILAAVKTPSPRPGCSFTPREHKHCVLPAPVP